MRKIYYFLLAFSILFNPVFIQSVCFSQMREEKQERVSQVQMLRKKPTTYNFNAQATIFSGYDNNVKLSPQGKGSIFEEALYSLNFNQPLPANYRINFNYDIDYLNYNSSATSTNLLNHLRFDLNKKLSTFFIPGIGYDFTDLYYPSNSAGDFMFHKGFIYLKNNITDNIFQQVTLEYGYKIHNSKKALSDSLTVLEDKVLTDKRQSAEYTIGSTILPKLLVQFSTRFSKNESNARYLDFYDYKSYEFTPSVNYKFSEKLNLIGYFTYLRKGYSERTISTGTKKEKDNTYYTNVGARYRLNKDNIASLFYTYRDNSTNEPLEKYTENAITLGWQHNF